MKAYDYIQTKDGWKQISYEDTKEYKAHRAALKRFEEMPPEQQMQFLVEIGIYTPEGQLTEAYGGPPAHPPTPLHSDK